MLYSIERNLLRPGQFRVLIFFALNCQTFAGRWTRAALVVVLMPIALLIGILSRKFAARTMHLALRGISEDRLEVLGAEYFKYVLKPRLSRAAEDEVRSLASRHPDLILFSRSLSHVVRPLARHLGVSRVLANRLDFRDGMATGRLARPILPMRSLFEWLFPGSALIQADALCRKLNWPDPHRFLTDTVLAATPAPAHRFRPTVVFDRDRKIDRLSVRESLRGKHILLAGVTGFIGKVWLAQLLNDVPEIGRIYLLIRRNKKRSAIERFEQIISSSPVFAAFHETHGDKIGEFMARYVEVIEGDVSIEGLGIDPETTDRLRRDLDIFVNSTGLTDFNPDLKSAVNVNVDAVMQVLEFVRNCDHAALMHLSTCFVAGQRDGRIPETLIHNYTPAGHAGFDAERVYANMHARIQTIEAHGQTDWMKAAFKREVMARRDDDEPMSESAINKRINRYRTRWTRRRLAERGSRLARIYGWPNTYCLSKSMAESLLAERAGEVPLAIVRPAIVESAIEQPFSGWNEGINTSAPLTHLASTYFRQLPVNNRKCLDLIAVDTVGRGMTLIAAALAERRHQTVYQLASSGGNPLGMNRLVELTGLSHRVHHHFEEGFRHSLRSRFDTIPVSKVRYKALSVPGQRLVLRGLKRLVALTPFREAPIAKAERGLGKIEKIIELYEPFILHNELFCEGENIRLLTAALPPDEVDAFGVNIESIDWREYMVNIHIPGLRRWVFPLIEGRELAPTPTHPFSMPAPPPENGSAAPTGTEESQAPCQSS